MSQKYPNTTATDGSGTEWVNHANITASDNVYSTCTLTSGGDASSKLKATNFGFSIPATAFVDGVVVEVERYSGLSNTITDTDIGLLIGSSPSGANRSTGAYWVTSESFVSYGSAADNWGNTLTPAIINSSGFGAYIACDNNSYYTDVASVDSIRITVYYTTGIRCGWTGNGGTEQFIQKICHGSREVTKIYHGSTRLA